MADLALDKFIHRRDYHKASRIHPDPAFGGRTDEGVRNEQGDCFVVPHFVFDPEGLRPEGRDSPQ